MIFVDGKLDTVISNGRLKYILKYHYNDTVANGLKNYKSV